MNNNNGSKEGGGSRAELDISLDRPHDQRMTRTGPISRCFSRLYESCTPCMTKHNPLPQQPRFGEKLHYAFMCPPHGKVAQWITKVFCAVAIWATFWALTGDQALPGGNFFGLLVLIYACVIAAKLVEFTPLPPLLGMLLVGFMLQNVPGISIGKDILSKWASSLRSIALVVILMKAGVGLDPSALKKTKWLALRLAFFPCIVEAVIDAIVAHYLCGFDWIWAFVMGFVFSAVSPAVVVPSMTSLQEKRLGTNMGIPTLCIAACSINDVIAISCFGVVLGVAFHDGHIAMNIAHGPIEILIGVVFGITVGVYFWFLPNKNSKNLLMYRFIGLAAASLFATFGFRKAKFPGAGALGTLIMAFTAGIGWRKRGWTSKNFPIKDVIGKLWKVFQPLLFGLIGNAVSLENLMSGNIGLGIGMLFIGLVGRLIVTFFCTFGMKLNWKEKLFITIAWLPKATVQAAIGPVALDTALHKGSGPETIAIATQVLTFAVLSILITAPLGAAGIGLSAPYLLKKEEAAADDDADEKAPTEETGGVSNPAFEDDSAKRDADKGQNNSKV